MVVHQGSGDVEGYSKGHIRRQEKADEGSAMRSIIHSKRLGRSGSRQKILLLHKDTSLEEFNKIKAIPQGRLASNAEKSANTTPPSASRLPGRQHGPFPGPWTGEAGVPGVAAGTTRDFQNLPDFLVAGGWNGSGVSPWIQPIDPAKQKKKVQCLATSGHVQICCLFACLQGPGGAVGPFGPCPAWEVAPARANQRLLTQLAEGRGSAKS